MIMLIGDKATFAIESGITEAYENEGSRALGFLVIYIGGKRYGVYSPNATLLACSFDEIQKRIDRRGMHTAPFMTESDPREIASAFRKAVYDPDQEIKNFFGILQQEFVDIIYATHLVWAPDGDEAFDDGSYILQFDVGQRVRLIAFKSGEGYDFDPQTLSELWLDADVFYKTLKRWRDGFVSEWNVAPKVVEGES